MKHTLHGAKCEICKKSIKVNHRSTRSICFNCNNDPPPEKYRCQGINGKKKRCGHWAKLDLKWCGHHIPKED